jgi:two-component system, OmpR family, alkaline phosphatase synthesis response regulator PhoP
MVTKPPTILFIEDDVWFSGSIKAGLSDFSVVTINDPEEAFSQIEKSKPDVILADVLLGSKSLIALLHELQSYVDTRDIPVVILSAHAKQISLDDAKAYGVKSIIDKSEVTSAMMNKALTAAAPNADKVTK